VPAIEQYRKVRTRLRNRALVLGNICRKNEWQAMSLRVARCKRGGE